MKSLRVYNIYDIFGFEDSELKKVVKNTFADPVTDILHYENPAQYLHFAAEFLPGQCDQRADSAEQCLPCLFIMKMLKCVVKLISWKVSEEGFAENQKFAY